VETPALLPRPRHPAEDDRGWTTADVTGAAVDLNGALHEARQGDEAAFVTLYRDLQPRLLRYATVLVGRDSAEDVTAEAWLQIARDVHKFTGDVDRFRGWAATIVHHRAMDLCRANSRRPTAAPAPVHGLDEPVGACDTAAAALDAVSTDTALALIAALPREQAQAVLLRAVVGLDSRTAGEVLGKRAGAVRVAAHRGLKRLARQLRYQPEEGRWTLD
jgi:RNA polymerase sigma-70 factor (ECF subfamily)